MKRRNFNKEEIDLIVRYYGEHGVRWCSERLGRSYGTVVAKAAKLGVRVQPECICKQIQRAWIKKPEKCCINPDRFQEISSAEVAYILGYIWADGYLNVTPRGAGRRSELKLTIAYEDYESIKDVLTRIGTWSVYEVPAGKRTVKRASVCTHVRQIVNRFYELGYDEKSTKSPTLVLSATPESLHCYFWRGFFDGDGSFKSAVRSSQATLTGSVGQDWSDFITLLDKLDIKYAHHVTRAKPGHGTSYIVMGSAEAIARFGEYIYRGISFDGIGLERKFQKWRAIYQKHIMMWRAYNLVIDEPNDYLDDIGRLYGLIKKYSGIITKSKIINHFHINGSAIHREITRLKDSGLICSLRSTRLNPYVAL